jgi:hypothetical protein
MPAINGTSAVLGMGEEHDPAPGVPSPVRREVIAIHIPSGEARRCEAGQGSSWNAAFEDDLQALYFTRL